MIDPTVLESIILLRNIELTTLSLRNKIPMNVVQERMFGYITGFRDGFAEAEKYNNFLNEIESITKPNQ